VAKFDQSAIPQWTSLAKTNGIDPLGMQNSSVRIYQRLLPGISNVTLRVRYYGLYVWMARHYAKHIGKTDPAIWQRQVRRTEALYALVAQATEDETGVAGAEWAGKRLSAAGNGRIDFAEDAEPGAEKRYLKNQWGAFGAAYRSQLFTIGLLAEVPGHTIPTPAPGVGDELAEAFEAAAGEAGSLFLDTVRRGRTSRKDLEAMAALVPSAIGRTKERNCYQAVLMPEGAEEGSPEDERCKTLKLILQWAEANGRTPGVAGLRWGLYSGYLDDGRRWTPKDHLERHRRRWAVYQSNECAHVALETLLAYLLALLETYPIGRRLDDLISEAAANVQQCLGVNPPTWGAFVEATAAPSNAASATDANSEWSLTRHARMTLRQHGMSTAQQAAASIRVLAVVQNRMSTRKEDVEAELADLDPQGFRSLLTELAFLDKNRATGFDAFLRSLFLDRVVHRHLWVAMRKLRYQGDYTFLFEVEDGLVRRRETDGPVWTGPRLAYAIAFLEDIGLLGPAGITARGRRAMEGE
jgi:hypothetical protein